MKKGTKLRLLHFKESFNGFIKAMFGMRVSSYSIISFMFLISFFVAFNTPTGEPKYLNGTVQNIRTSSNTIERNAGGFISASAKVALENGERIQLSIDRPPLPKAGDKVRVAKSSRKINGIIYSYAGLKINEN